MSDLQDYETTKDLQQLQANENVPDIENAEATIQIPTELFQQVDTNDDVHGEEFGNSRVDVPPEIDSRCIYKVSRHLHANRKQVYVPVVVSLGPYHHGKQELSEMEKFKEEELNLFMEDSAAKDPNKNQDFFHGKIMENIEAIRANYERVFYSDEELTHIILRDACFLIRVLDNLSAPRRLLESCEHRGGLPINVLMARDLYMLENQIPFWIIKQLIYLRFGEDKADELLYNFLGRYNDSWPAQQPPWKGKALQPVHLLDAFQETLVDSEGTKSSTKKNSPKTREAANEATRPTACRKILFKLRDIWRMTIWKPIHKVVSDERMMMEILNLPCRSVTYLQAKGIHFRPSSPCLQDIRFTSYNFSGMLHLPILFVRVSSKVIFSNIIAFELSSPDAWRNGHILSYVNFLKSLIDTSKDVKELRERGILHSFLDNDEEVVSMFKDMDTYGMNNFNNFENVKRAINEHCNNKTKTWMTDLAYNYFRNPWTAIAVITATFVLCLSFLQTYYTIHPVD